MVLPGATPAEATTHVATAVDASAVPRTPVADLAGRVAGNDPGVEQIKRLPAESWPGGIDSNLEFARRRAQ